MTSLSLRDSSAQQLTVKGEILSSQIVFICGDDLLFGASDLARNVWICRKKWSLWGPWVDSLFDKFYTMLMMLKYRCLVGLGAVFVIIISLLLDIPNI